MSRSLPELNYCPSQDALVILYEDRDIVVVDKPSGLLSVPGPKEHLQDSVETRVSQQWGQGYAVHRLDLWTSGILVIAIRRKAEAELHRQFRERTTRKHYVAQVHGIVEQDEGNIDLPLCVDPACPPLQHVDPVAGKPALTHYRVLERLPHSTVVELTPTTGRSHQLRVHMQQIGHPIWGDNFYAPPLVQNLAPRLLLHAEWLQIHHPFSGELLEFISPCPFYSRSR